MTFSIPRRTAARNTNLISALLALIVAMVPPAAWANPITYPSGQFTLHVDNAGAIRRVAVALDVAPPAVVVPAVTQAPSPAAPAADPQQDTRAKIPTHWIAKVDAPRQECAGPKSRICKVPASLVPVYEKIADEEDVPLEMLVAITSWETLFNARALATKGEHSCGLAQFNGWRKWGFASLEECFEPEANVRKLAHAFKVFKTKGGSGIRNYACRHNAGPRAGLSCRASQGYGNAVRWAIDNVYVR